MCSASLTMEIGAEMLEVVRLGLRLPQASQGLSQDGRAETGAALVEEQQAVVLQGALHKGGRTIGARRAEAGTALEESQPGKVGFLFTGSDDFAGENADGLTVRLGVVQGHVEPVVGEYQAGDSMGNGQGGHIVLRIFLGNNARMNQLGDPFERIIQLNWCFVQAQSRICILNFKAWSFSCSMH